MQAVLENNSMSTPVHSGIVVDLMAQHTSVGLEAIDTELQPEDCGLSIVGAVMPTPELMIPVKRKQREQKVLDESASQDSEVVGNLDELEAQIKDLWSAHQLGEDKLYADQQLLSAHKAKCNAVRLALEEKLYTYKKQLVGKGRDGKWGKFLRDAHIVRPTADRYVERGEKRVRAEKFLTEELSERQIAIYAGNVARNAKAKLKSEAALRRFVNDLVVLLMPDRIPEGQESV